MNLLILNCGSSSIKCSLFRLNDFGSNYVKASWSAKIQWKNSFEDPSLEVAKGHKPDLSLSVTEKKPSDALRKVIQDLLKGKWAAFQSGEKIDAIGHRIVHGGKEFTSSVKITPAVKQKLVLATELAPLHNRPALDAIDTVEELLPDTLQIAVFDTAFHLSMPKESTIYSGPYSWYEMGIQRFGFHGISFQYCLRRSEAVLKTHPASHKMIICHLGSGASLCAIKDGSSYDTTMGFTPLEGLMMDTRAGSIDPGIILHLLQDGKTTVQGLTKILYKESGLLGLSGSTSSMQEIIERTQKNDERASLALKVYIHRLCAELGRMIASIQGIDSLIFTGGIGENSALIRQQVCSHFAFLQCHLDAAANENYSQEDRLISSAESNVKVLLIHTQEAFEIALECRNLIKS